MSKKSGKVDFNNPGDIGDIVSQMASAKTGKKVKINFKLLIVIFIYFMITGLCLNVYWIYKLVLNLF